MTWFTSSQLDALDSKQEQKIITDVVVTKLFIEFMDVMEQFAFKMHDLLYLMKLQTHFHECAKATDLYECLITRFSDMLHTY